MRKHRAPILGTAATGLLLMIGPALTACTGAPTDAQATSPATASSPSPTKKTEPRFPIRPATSPVDAAALKKAETWLAGATVPPGVVVSANRPDGVASSPTPQMWCTPMAHAVGYWTLPGMSADETMAWLTSHSSQGMTVVSSGAFALATNSVCATPPPGVMLGIGG